MKECTKGQLEIVCAYLLTQLYPYQLPSGLLEKNAPVHELVVSYIDRSGRSLVLAINTTLVDRGSKAMRAAIHMHGPDAA